MPENRCTQISLLVVIDTSVLNHDDLREGSWHYKCMKGLGSAFNSYLASNNSIRSLASLRPRSLNSQTSACNSYLASNNPIQRDRYVDIAVTAFNEDISDFVDIGETGPVDLSLSENQLANWNSVIAWTVDWVFERQRYYKDNEIPYFPTRVLYFSMVSPGSSFDAQTVKRVREAQASGAMELKAFGIMGISDYAKLIELSDDVEMVAGEGHSPFEYRHRFNKEARRLDQVLKGIEPYNTAEVAAALKEAINALKAEGINKSEIYGHFATALKRSESWVRRRILTGDRDESFTIEQARKIVKALGRYRNYMPVDFEKFTERIGAQYRAAQTAKIPAPAIPTEPEIRTISVSNGKSLVNRGEQRQRYREQAEPMAECRTLQLPFDIPTDAEVELEGLIGLEGVKAVIGKILDFAKLNKRHPLRGKSQSQYLHMGFVGNPGTCKTTVARLVARILAAYGILSKGELVEVGRDGLVGKYTGSTAPKTAEVFEKAKGSVLLIDEAYSLVDSGRGDFGDEALATIVRAMENGGGDPVVIMAGYPKEMEALLYQNAGLKSRIKFIVNFPDYTDEEMLLIVEHIAKRYGYKLGEGVRERVLPLIIKAKEDKSFGNGRWARNLIEQAELNLASRVVRLPDEDVTETIRNTLLAEDFERPLDVVIKPKKRSVGFVSRQEEGVL